MSCATLEMLLSTSRVHPDRKRAGGVEFGRKSLMPGCAR